MDYSRKHVKRGTFYTTFKKGPKAWLSLVLIIFVYSFTGIAFASQTLIIDKIDESLGLEKTISSVDLTSVKEYLAETEIGEDLNDITEDAGLDIKATDEIVDSLSKSHALTTYVISFNQGYIKRNSAEVLALFIIAVIATFLFSNIVRKVIDVGLYRYTMENMMQKNVQFRRLFAPFTNKQLMHITWVMVRYSVSFFLWNLTIVGGVIRYYSYRFVPILIAENPELTWKEAKTLALKMTKGYKWKIFVTEISCVGPMILIFVTLLDMLFGAPFLLQIEAVMYHELRNKNKNDLDMSLFTERAFDEELYVEDMIREKEAKKAAKKAAKKGLEVPEVVIEKKEKPEPVYNLPDPMIGITNFSKRDDYTFKDFVLMFFTFAFVGYAWEVMLHLVEDHEFVNRGTMYGPWLPVYGFGGMFIIFFLNRFKNSKPKLFISAILLCGLLEYASSLVLDFAYNSYYWDYKDMSFNINGRVCLAGLIAFALGGFLGVYILGPLLKNLRIKLGKKRSTIICSILIAAFLIDYLCCKIFGMNVGSGVGGVY